MTLQELRKANEKNRIEAAKVLGVSVNAVSNYENGVRSIGIEQVLALAKLYDCTAEEVITAQIESLNIRQTNEKVGGNIKK